MAREAEIHNWKLKQEQFPLAPHDRRTVSDMLGIQPAAPADPPGVEEPGLLYPFGETELAYLKGEIEAVEAGGLPETGGTVTGTITIEAEPDAHLDLQGRYQILTDNAGTPGHEVTGPNLLVYDVAKDHYPAKFLSIGQLQLNFKSAALADNAVAHGLQVRRQAATAAAVGFGSGIQVFLPDSAGTEVECANIQVDMASVTPAAVNSRLIFRGCIAGVVGTELFRTTSVGNFVGDFKILATGGLGSGGSVAATTLASPGTVIKRLPVYDETGALLGSVPIYSAGSFS